jgi:hypothetical protein
MREPRAHPRVVRAPDLLVVRSTKPCLSVRCIARGALIMIEARALSGSWRR